MALAKLDDLQHFDGMSEEEYGREYKQADEMVHAAEEAAWTDRDKWIAANLSAYLMSTDVRRHEQESKIKLNNSSDDRVRSFASCPSSMSGNEVESAILHQALK
jgi:hypothetical protein